MEEDFNAQFDYTAELRSEHAEGLAALEAEAAAGEAYNAAIADGATEEEAMAAYYAA